jgi:hypothetical protein
MTHCDQSLPALPEKLSYVPSATTAAVEPAARACALIRTASTFVSAFLLSASVCNQ